MEGVINVVDEVKEMVQVVEKAIENVVEEVVDEKMDETEIKFLSMTETRTDERANAVVFEEVIITKKTHDKCNPLQKALGCIIM